ncbi:MAG: hypothetical protein NC200_03475 [Candidatus Gastranaerophilales bacterium]|nr:hypothetical protein [Candidatus Gastranaerophilales bacterium]
MESKLDSIFETTVKVKTNLNTEDLCSDLDISALLAKTSVPYSHRRIADNYVIMKRICSFQIVQPRITKVETALLMRYSFNTLENTTISKVNQELVQLKEWATSTNDTLRADAEEIMRIRVKELKFMLSNNYTQNSNEVFKGYKAVETYLKNVTNYYSR